MTIHPADTCFTEEYGRLRAARAVTREDGTSVPEDVVQCVWYDHLFSDKDLRLEDGRPLRVVSPGWWNHGEGPDFKGAQLEIGGKLRTGDIEIHLKHGAWKQHGHHRDRRYDEVILVAVLESQPPNDPPITSEGRRIPTLLLANYLTSDIGAIADRLAVDEYPYETPRTFGACAALVDSYGGGRLDSLLKLAGEWRVLSKARAIRERMERVGAEQAAYEAFMTACGFSRFKHQFRMIAQELPYERVRQLAREDPLLVESAYLKIAGLIPDEAPDGGSLPHFERIRTLVRSRFSGLQRLPVTWERVGVRPVNYPERRLAGAARLLARTAQQGFLDTLDRIWRDDVTPVKRRRAFEALFPNALGFWAEHCTWTGTRMTKALAPLGAGRVRSIIGNVFVPVALARARQAKDRVLEERIFRFFAVLPKEPDNHIQKIMAPRAFGTAKLPKLDFRTQQGLLQLFHDWCEPNPSCRNCAVIPYLNVQPAGAPDDASGANLGRAAVYAPDTD
ncbi:MAG: DUF2851 family protein [Candidatus Hydrogenedentes bacterium]|nr:DUF2851 family protein [Candidatus Hydrogenedentota bacterium]